MDLIYGQLSINMSLSENNIWCLSKLVRHSIATQCQFIITKNLIWKVFSMMNLQFTVTLMEEARCGDWKQESDKLLDFESHKKLLWLIDLVSFLALPVLIRLHSLVKFRGWFFYWRWNLVESSPSPVVLFIQLTIVVHVWKRQQSHFFLFAYTHAKFNSWVIVMYIFSKQHIYMHVVSEMRKVVKLLFYHFSFITSLIFLFL